MNRLGTDPDETVLLPERAVPVADKVDVLVVGGGTSGVAAAVAAARQGAVVMLVERYGFLGGTAVAAPVPTFQEGPKVQGKPVIRGLFAELKIRLAQHNAIQGESAGYEFNSAGLDLYGPKAKTGTFEPAMLQLVCLDLCEAAGVRLLLHSYLVDSLSVDRMIHHAVLINKGGLVAVAATQFIDATGDGDLAVSAGARAEVGRPGDGSTQPPSLVFELANVDFARLATADWDTLWSLFTTEVPDVLVPRGRFMFQRLQSQGRLRFGAMTHVPHVNAADPSDRTYIEVAGRQQATSVLEFCRRHVPGCEQSVIAAIGVEAGIRESRRILADYVMTREDVLGARKFSDAVGCSTSWIDIHDPDGHGIRHEYLPRDDWFEIPYRTLVTAGVKNLYTVGRAISCTHEALGALRTMPTGIMTGEAAGVAAALCARTGAEARNLDVTQLQRALVEAGAFVGSAQSAAVPAISAPGGSMQRKQRQT